MILVDWDTAISPETSQEAKDALIEAVVADPEAIITVLNANHTMTLGETKARLREVAFPFDTALVNPLPQSVDCLTYKTMFAARLQGSSEHKTVLVIDKDVESRRMWADSGVGNVA